VTDATAALEGARAILVERFSEDASLIGTLREEVWLRSRLRSRVRSGKVESGAKFADYFDFSEPLVKLPPHRILVLFHGEKEGASTGIMKIIEPPYFGVSPAAAGVAAPSIAANVAALNATLASRYLFIEPERAKS
jgi:uncharacterized protein